MKHARLLCCDKKTLVFLFKDIIGQYQHNFVVNIKNEYIP